LEAAIQHIGDLASQFESIASKESLFDNGEDMYDYGALMHVHATTS
jgi:hypothetical protein